ncbi:monocarboxylate transporter 13 [Cephus cinctus]|uniref:Monocarboxylate transporter 13 n=1 Tax=Cephus cinctus TaxID=211228 RepID=A0AAJ7BQN8_CEPCN|nr:monocarboxylate transporter 13 [Cephus cinctus]XP_015592062.1 monocarboxylate transporter 13 [Cephus cinctus]
MVAKTQKTKLVAPDGGWGWVVLVSALVVNFLIPGTVKSFGVFFVEFLQVFKASPTAASWMPALCYFLYSFLGPLSSVLSMKYSYKTVTIIGGAFAASGMMLSYFANSVTYLYFSYGLMVGIGAGLSFPPTVYIVTSYFVKLRGFANGLCISGSAIGTIVLPPFLQYLLDKFGYRGAVLIMGAITLNTLVCGLLYHPVEQHMKEVPIPIEDGVDNQALSLDEVALDKKEEMEPPKSGNPEEETARRMSEVSLGQDKTVIFTVVETINEEEDQVEEVVPQKIDNDEEQSNDTATVVNDTADTRAENGDPPSGKELNVISGQTPQTSRNNSIRHSMKNETSYRLSRQHSIVSEMGTIALSPKMNVPRMFRRIFKAQPSKKATNKPSKIKNVKDTESQEDSSSMKFFDFSVLRDPMYLVILISNSTSAISNTNFMILLPSYAISQGFDKNMSALLLSIVSALDLVGRIGGASLSDIDFIPKYYYFVGGLGTSGIALALLPMASSYTMLSFFCALFGLSSGMYIGITTVILADMLGTEKLSSSYGISLFVNGVLQLVGPPVCGSIYEQVGSYKPIFLAFGIILILGTALWAAVPIIKKNKKVVEGV